MSPSMSETSGMSEAIGVSNKRSFKVEKVEKLRML